MSIWQNLKIGVRLGIGIGVLLALLVAVAGMAYVSLTGAGSSFAQYQQLSRETATAANWNGDLMAVRFYNRVYLAKSTDETEQKTLEVIAVLTDEIAAQVRAIQEATDNSARAIQGITQTITRVNEIASAVEEQGAATREISRNVQQAAHGTTEVSSNIGSVTQAAQETGPAATQLLASAGELARNGTLLRSQVDEFLKEVRA